MGQGLSVDPWEQRCQFTPEGSSSVNHGRQCNEEQHIKKMIRYLKDNMLFIDLFFY